MRDKVFDILNLFNCKQAQSIMKLEVIEVLLNENIFLPMTEGNLSPIQNFVQNWKINTNI
jgi:hypothetical protein